MPLAGGACCPSPRIPPHSRLSASIFGPSGLIGQHLPKVFISPNAYRVLIKKLVVPIFGAKECIIRQELVLKIYKKFRGSWPPGRPPGPGPPRREGDICSHPRPCPPAKCWCPSASSRLATALAQTSWISASRQVNSAFFNSCYFHNIGFSIVYAPAEPPELGGTTQIGGGGTLKKFPARRFVPPTSKPCRCLWL